MPSRAYLTRNAASAGACVTPIDFDFVDAGHAAVHENDYDI